MEMRSVFALAPKDVRSVNFTGFAHTLKKAGTTGTELFSLCNQALALFRYGTDNKITRTENRVIHRQGVI
jgi:hypothetical protein